MSSWTSTGGSTGGRPRVPVGFGMYESGRSGYAPHKADAEYAWVRDKRVQGVQVNVPPQMDPGLYNPYTYEDAGTNPMCNTRQSKETRKPFDSTEVRELATSLFGSSSPGAIYDNTHTQYDYAYYKTLGGSRNVFESTSLQRPESRSAVPGPDHYSPNPKVAIYTQLRASFNGKLDRFGPLRGGMSGQKPQTETVNGPGTYEQNHGTLLDDCRDEMRRMSKVRAPFGTTTPQRALPNFNARDASPDLGPGHYEKLIPRVKDQIRMRKSDERTSWNIRFFQYA